MRRLFAICCLLCCLYAHVAQAADATSFDPTPIPVVSQGISGVPIGTVIAWPSSTLPRATNGVIPSQGACVAAVSDEQAEALGCEWLEADGSVLNSTAYAELSAVAGPKLPDYRGVFLRGRGGNAAPLGELQDQLVGPHAHGLKAHVAGAEGWPDIGLTTGNQDWGYRDTDPYAFQPLFTWSAGTGMGVETRPVNRAVVYLVRAR